MLKEAHLAVSNIDKNQLIIIKSYISPPKFVVNLLEAICLLFGFDENWDSAKKFLLNDFKLIEKLVNLNIIDTI